MKETKVNVKIHLTNFVRTSISNTPIELIRIDDYFYHKPKIIKEKSNSEGNVNLIIPKGEYVITIYKGNSYYEKLIHIGETPIKIKLPLFFGLLKTTLTVNPNIIKQTYEKVRTDKEFCFYCGKDQTWLPEIFLCHYCEKYFCPEHHLPENHNCWGHPTSPPGGRLKEIHFGGGKIKASGD